MFRPTPDREQYAPGQAVQVSLLVTDERGRPVPAVLGVSVVDDHLWKVADGRPASMFAEFLLAGDVAGQADLAVAPDELADEALDLMLNGQRGRPGEPPPLMCDNIEQIRSNYEKCLADYQAGRSAGAEYVDAEQLLRRLGAGLAGGHVGADADRLGHAPVDCGGRGDYLLSDYRRDFDGPRPDCPRPGRGRAVP